MFILGVQEILIDLRTYIHNDRQIDRFVSKILPSFKHAIFFSFRNVRTPLGQTDRQTDITNNKQQL